MFTVDLTAWLAAIHAEEDERDRLDSGEATDGGDAFRAAATRADQERQLLNQARGAPDGAALAERVGLWRLAGANAVVPN